MIIKEIEVKNFGRFSKEKIEFKDGINLIYGANESGKTTIYHVINALLFGMEKKRGRAAKTDQYQTYQPWEQKTWYEAAMRFETGGKNFFLERNFYHAEKSARLICETDGEELSVAQGDLQMILGDTDEALFLNTAAVGQLKMKPQEIVYDYLKNHIGSLVEEGKQSVDVVRTLEILAQKKKDLEQKQKKAVQEIRQQIHGLEANIKLVEKEIRESSASKKLLEETYDEMQKRTFREKKGFWKKLIAWIKGLIFWKKKRGKEDADRIELLQTEERIRFFGEMLGEKESLLEELKLEEEVLYKKIHDLSKEEEIRAVMIAMERIQQISAVHREEVLEKVFFKASQVLSAITDGKYQKLRLNENHEPEVWDGCRGVNVFQVSSGCADQIYLALRIALQDLFFQEENMPLMFDDAFVYFDDTRLENFLRYLGTLQRQVLIFSCQKREAVLMEKIGVPYRVLNL